MKVACRTEDGDEAGEWAWVVVGVREVRVARVGAWRQGSFPIVGGGCSDFPSIKFRLLHQ